MSLFVWKDDYSVNIKLIDDQHIKLVEMINALHSAMQQGKGSDVLKKIIDEMAHYTMEHFKDEENIMRQNGYPGLAEHIVLHEKFVARVVEFQKQLEDGKFMLSISVSIFLSDWLSEHILKTDKAYMEFLSLKGVK